MVRKSAFYLSLIFLSSCGHLDENTDPVNLSEIEVTLSNATAADYAFGTAVPGTVQSRDSATIEAKLNARIDEVLVQEGDLVKKDQLLARLDSQEIDARLSQAEAAMQQAQKDLHRAEMLLPQRVISQRDYDNAQSQAKMTTAALEEAKTILSYTQVTAPFGGIVSRKYVSAGDLAVLGKPLLVIDNPDALRFEAAVPETTIAELKIGQLYPVSVRAVEEQLNGEVSEISPSADLATRSFTVKFNLPQNKALRLGQYGTVALPKAAEKTITVSRSALVSRGQLEMVFVVKNSRAMLRLVRSGRIQGDRIEILSGLEDGEQIVLDPPKTIIDQQPVKIAP